MKMTNQQILDKVHETFIKKENGRCSNHAGECMYNGLSVGRPNHPGCAVGCLLPPHITARMDAIEREGGASIHFFFPESLVMDATEEGDKREYCKDAELVEAIHDIIGDPDNNTERCRFLENLQSWHDTYLGDSSRQYALVELQALAKDWGLVFPGDNS